MDELTQLRMEYNDKLRQHYLSEEVFTLPWFINAAFLLLIYIIWLRLVDKRRLKDLLLFGSLVAVANGLIDIIAVTSELWIYKIRLLPISPAPFPFDYTVIPILYMLVMQYTNSWKGYLLGSLLTSGVFSFVIIPVYILLGINEYLNFNVIYSFILVFAYTAIIKLIFNWISGIQERHIRKER